MMEKIETPDQMIISCEANVSEVGLACAEVLIKFLTTPHKCVNPQCKGHGPVEVNRVNVEGLKRHIKETAAMLNADEGVVALAVIVKMFSDHPGIKRLQGNMLAVKKLDQGDKESLPN